MSEEKKIKYSELINVLINFINNALIPDTRIDDDTRKGILCSASIKEIIFNAKSGFYKVTRLIIHKQKRKDER